MNILLISQCSKNALTETRRVLDQFAERRGDRTWQTAITQQGLTTLYKMLRKKARKNTAVACHWIRGKNHSELIWVVGDAKRFNAYGATPTNTTARDVLRSQDENDWHNAEEIRLLVSLAALLHDLGKANQAFQNKISKKNSKPKADAYRHEWISLRLFEAFVGQSSDEEWLSRLANLKDQNEKGWVKECVQDGIDRRPLSPFEKLPPLAQVIGWLIVSHHRMPMQKYGEPFRTETLERLPVEITSSWCGESPELSDKEIKDCWNFKKGLPTKSRRWQQHIKRVVQSILQHPCMLKKDWITNPHVLHYSRLSLMLADHYYSGEGSKPQYGDKKFPLYANTDRETGNLKQRLDEHLVGVEVNASRIVRTLPKLTNNLPRIARHKRFRQRNNKECFRWQDKAFDLAEGLRDISMEQGFFGVNMASTGCGKTLANGRILYGLADSQRGARFVIALGLRTLTLQTGDVYRERMELGAEDLAVLVGGGAIRKLHGLNKEESPNQNGSESLEDLLPEQHYVHFEGSLEDGPLNKWLARNRDAQKLINAPVVACTIDHLIPATESTRGGYQIAPMLRLMTSDLVLDEPDDFGMEDLPALTRLVHWAGLLGSRVLLSSATLPPSLIQGLFEAYAEGRKCYQENRGIPGLPLNICCAWFDEYSTQSGNYPDKSSYRVGHEEFIEKRLKKLSAKEIRRKAKTMPLSIGQGLNRKEICHDLAKHLHSQLHILHSKHHTVDPVSNKRVSFGLIRMANIGPLTETAQALFVLGAKSDYHIHLCVYHSKHPLLVRSNIEKKLDLLLNRTKELAIFEDNFLRHKLDRFPEKNHIFVIMATAVAEVGRDHDYDWAIVEPSSMRSIIQLAGRIRRHRFGIINIPNLYLLNTNVRHLENKAGEPAFCKPGFENKQFLLNTHILEELLTSEQLAVINASSRISERKELQPRHNLVDLEHSRLRSLMLGEKHENEKKDNPVNLWWTTKATLSGELQRKQPFRNDPLGRQRYVLLPDDNEEIGFYKLNDNGDVKSVTNLLHDIDIERGPRISFFVEEDYLEALNLLAEKLGMETDACARRFGIIDLPEKGCDDGWYYHEVLGFSKFIKD